MRDDRDSRFLQYLRTRLCFHTGASRADTVNCSDKNQLADVLS